MRPCLEEGGRQRGGGQTETEIGEGGGREGGNEMKSGLERWFVVKSIGCSSGRTSFYSQCPMAGHSHL